MVEPIIKEYISATSKSFISNNNNGKMIEKNFIEIEGTFLLKIRDNPIYGNKGDDVFKHINSFLEVVEPLKIRGLSHDRFRLSVFPISLSGAVKEWFTNECIGAISTWDDLVKKFVLKFYNLCEHDEDEETDDDDDPDEAWLENGVPYQLCDHICEPYRFKNGKTKWPTCNSDIDGFCNGGDMSGMVRVGSMTYFQDHSWYDGLADGKLKDQTLALKTKIKGSWGDATPGVLKFCKWLKSCFENFHELEYERDHEASNIGCNQEDQGHKVDPIPKPSNCKVRRFKMMKYSFNDGKEYITKKESEHLTHSKKSLDAYRELLRLTHEGWVVTTPDE
ncbi:hypothetical protein Tco_0003019 [Tanacetum coccineum]